MKPKITLDRDVQFLAITVAKLLMDEHHDENAPSPGDYEVDAEQRRPNGSSEIRVSVELSRGLLIDVRQHWWGDGDRNAASILEAATEIAGNIAAVREVRHKIVDMTTEVRTAVAREIAKGRRRKLPYRLLSATPYAPHGSMQDGLTVRVEFERLSEALRPERETFTADCAEDVVETFGAMRAQQNERMVRRAELDAVGATGRIDGVVVNALREAGHDIADILKLLATTDGRTVDLVGRGNARGFRLGWDGGDVHAAISLAENGTWHKGSLTFQSMPVSPIRIEGRRLRDVVENSVFDEDVRICSAYGDKGGYGTLSCTKYLLNFNAETGRLWAA